MGARRLGARLAAAADRPLPAPPAWLRRGPFRAEAFRSPLRSTRLTSQLGGWLGIAFGICFATGLASHLIQHPPGWFWWPSRPVWLYRLTQGLHVATGLATVPLLGAKLWSVYPRLFTWPPARTVVHAVERGSVAVLVAAALFQVVTGILNVARWYPPMGFFFTTAHYWTAWLAIGALLLHIAVQLPAIRRGLADRASEPATQGLSRRGLLRSTEAGWVAIATPEDMRADPRTVGAPVPGVEVVILADDGRRLPPGEHGTISVRSDAAFEGYASGESTSARKGCR